MIEDMSSIYADITGVGAVTAAKMAVEDFGGTVLGMPIEVVSADHQNKADIASATAREWFENQHVDALMDVATSATALAAIDVAKPKNKIVVLNGPGAARISNEACTPVSIHYTYDNYALAHGTGGAMVKAGYDTWFFVTADYAFGHDLEQVTAGVIKASGGQVLGGVRVPINTSDFSSALLQAQSSKAKVVASPTPAPTRKIPSSKPPSSASFAAGRSSRAFWSSSTTSTALAWMWRKACY